MRIKNDWANHERRRNRAATATQALRYQLEACCKDGRLQAMVVADEDGLPLAASGDACDEVAARMALARTREFDGVLFGAGHWWDVQMVKVEVEGSDLLVCAVGGTAVSRARPIARGAAGTRRILAV